MSQLRFFGTRRTDGTASARGARDSDFLARPCAPERLASRNADLDPYRRRQCGILDIPSGCRVRDGARPRDGAFRWIFWRRSLPTRFGRNIRTRSRARRTSCSASRQPGRSAAERGARHGDRRGLQVLRSRRSCFTVKASAMRSGPRGWKMPGCFLNFRSQVPEGSATGTGCSRPVFPRPCRGRCRRYRLHRPRPVPEVSYASSRAAFQDASDARHGVLRDGVRPAGGLAHPPADAHRRMPDPGIERMIEGDARRDALRCRAGGLAEFRLQRDPAHPSGYVWAQTEQPLLTETRVVLNEERDPFRAAAHRPRLDARRRLYYRACARPPSPRRRAGRGGSGGSSCATGCWPSIRSCRGATGMSAISGRATIWARHHADGADPGAGRGRCRLPGPWAQQSLYRRIERVSRPAAMSIRPHAIRA